MPLLYVLSASINTAHANSPSQEADSDNFENWENLIKSCETLEGGLNRNSSPQALATFRDAYDRFLFKFPLLFGYWKKYADMEFNIAGPESAQMVCTALE
jgi:pre-mRNA-processing factor 39